MRKVAGLSLVAAAALLVVAVVPVAAFARQNVTMTVTTIFEEGEQVPDDFVATGIPGCDAGTVTDANVNIQFTRAGGMYSGDKVFDCGSGNGFVVHLSARFDDSGSIGSWSVVASWGAPAGMSGSGKLSGVPADGGITDNYVGAVRF